MLRQPAYLPCSGWLSSSGSNSLSINTRTRSFVLSSPCQSGFFVKFGLVVIVSKSQNPFPAEPLNSHAPRAWWLEPAKYAPIAWRPSEPRHTRSTAGPALSPCRSSFLFFFGGGILKREGREKRGGGLDFLVCSKRDNRIKYTYG